MRKLLLILIPIATLIVSCSNYGEKVKINDKIEVYLLGDSVTEADAKALGNYIVSLDKENKNEKSFQLSKESGVYIVKMPVDQSQVKIDASMDASFTALRMLFELEVFKGKDVSLVLADNQFKPFKTYSRETQAESK
jgi:hypothetical protein